MVEGRYDQNTLSQLVDTLIIPTPVSYTHLDVYKRQEQAGQSVHHLHFHVLSGRDMTWPPG